MGTTMRDTTIRSHFGKKLKIGYRGNGTVQIECGPDHDNTGNHVRIYKLDELKAALGAKPTMPEQPPLADWERDLLGPQNDDGRYWHKRAEDAEAKLARIEERVDASPSRWIKAQYAEAVREVPAFTLPTEVPATIECHHKDDGRTYRLDLWVDGDGGVLWLGPGCAPLGAGQVMDLFDDHRLLDSE